MKANDVSSLPADLREALVKICGKTPEFKSLECDAIVDVVVPPFVPPADVPNGINLKMAYKIQRPDQMLAKIVSRDGLGMGHYYFKRVVADYFQDRTGTTYIISGNKLATKGPSGGWSQTTFQAQVETNALTANITSTGMLPDIQRYLHSWYLLSDPSACRVQLEKQAEGPAGQGQVYKLVLNASRLASRLSRTHSSDSLFWWILIKGFCKRRLWMLRIRLSPDLLTKIHFSRRVKVQTGRVG